MASLAVKRGKLAGQRIGPLGDCAGTEANNNITGYHLPAHQRRQLLRRFNCLNGAMAAPVQGCPTTTLALRSISERAAAVTCGRGFVGTSLGTSVKTGCVGLDSPNMKLNPYLTFDGRCREAFEFYQKALGGRITFMQTIGESPMATSSPPAAHDRIMHVTLQIGDQVLQGADAPLGQFTTPAGFCVATEFDDAAEGERVFNALAEKGWVQMAFQETFWTKGFGMVVDEFGTPWIVNVAA